MAFTSIVSTTVTREIVTGGTQQIVNGGQANSTFIFEAGYQYISSGGMAYSTIIQNYGQQYIFAGGLANVTSITSGWQFISSDGIAKSTVLSAYGRQIVSSGGIADGITINWLGTQTVQGVANVTIISSGGSQYISSGGAANTTTINYGGSQTVKGVANFTTINSGGMQYVSAGEANFNTINSGGMQNVSASGITNSTTINSGMQICFGVANFTTINGGEQTVYRGGIANSTTINEGNQAVYGVANSTTIFSGGQFIYRYGVANSTIINPLGYQNLTAGEANFTTINSGGRQYVSASGVTNFTTINSGGEQDIYFGGVANINIINSGGVQSGNGIANSTTINFGGVQTISMANSTTINSGGRQTILGGCSANVINQNSGAVIQVDTDAEITGGTNTRTDGHSAFSIVNGVASNFLLENGGFLNVLFGHSAIDTIITSSSWQNVSAGGVTNSTTINSGGFQYVSAGGVTNSTTINSGGWQYVCGTASSTNINSGGWLMVSSGGSATELTIASGGSLGWDFNTVIGGTNNGIAIEPSSFNISYNLHLNGWQYVSSGYIASNTIINSGGIQRVYSGGTANGDTINNNGCQNVYSGGTTTSTTINGGIQGIYSGGTATSTTINGGVQAVYSRSVANSNIIESGSQYISSGGIANWTAINSHGSQYIYAGGLASNTTISGGFQNVSSNGTATNTTINNNGWQYVSSGGIVSNSIVNSGGSMYISSGGIAGGSLIISGGHVTLADSSAVTTLTTMRYELENAQANDILLNVNSGTLGAGSTTYALNLNNAAWGTYVLASGTNLSGMSNKNLTITYNSQNINLKVGSSYIFTDGNKLSLNLDDSIRDQLTAVFADAVNIPKGLNLTVTGNNVNLYWSDVTDASGIKHYEVQVDNNSNFSSPEYSASPVASAASVNSLADGIYYWKVRTQDNAGNYSDWTSGSSFTVDITAPSAPATLTRTVAGNNVTLDWADSTDAPSGVKQYQVQLDKHADFSSLEYSATTANSTANFNGLTDGTFYWRVNTQDNAGNTSAWSNGTSFVSDVGGTIGSALLISSPSTTGWVGTGDAADFYKLTLTNAGMLTLGLTGLTGNADLALLNSAGTVLKTSANTGITAEAIIGLALQAGDYYVKVAPGFGVKDASYTLTHAEKYCPADTVANTWQTALDIGSGVDNWVGFGDAADFYKLTMTNAGALTLGLSGLTGNADLALLNSAGTSLKTSANTGITNEAISNVALVAGTYYVKVAAGTGVNDASYTLTHTEKYTPADKAANDYKTAQDISTLDNWVGFGDVADFYKLTMTNAGSLSLGLTGLTGNADLSLLNSAGTVLKTSAKTGTADESISNVLLLAGTYYVKVAAGYSVNDASYTLTHTEKYTPGDAGANTWQAARNIDSGVDTWVGFGDAADFYKLTLTNAGMLTLGLTGLTGNADLSLLNSAGTAIKTSANTGITNEAINNIALLAGTYYVKVATGFGVNDASYTLAHTEKYCPADKAANTWQTALDISALDNWVGFGDSADYYKLTMTNAGMLTLGMTGLTGNADLSLLNSTGTVLKSSANAGTANESIAQNLLAGTYYVKVAAGSGVNDVNYSLSNTIKYTPADKAANTWQTAQDISNLDNWVGFGDTADVYKLTMSNAGTLTLGLTGLTGNADLSLLNSAGTALKTSANAGITNEAITGVSLLAGTYYVKVAAGYGVNDASYNLSNTVSYFPGDTSDQAGNTIATAKLIDAPTQTGWVGFGDTDDCYRFDLATVAIGTLRLHDMTGSNADLTLYNAKGIQLKKSASMGVLEDSITSTLAAGTYYARVNAVSGSSIDYKLDFTKNNLGMLAS